MSSVVIAAHNEGSVIGRCLESVVGYADEIVVVANGCSDDTATVARRYAVGVIELAEASKSAALNAGDAAVRSFPRFYIDGDVVLADGGIADLIAALAAPDALVAVPGRTIDVSGRPWPVRAYYNIHSRLPAVHNGMYGRGVIALSEQARARFDTIPAMIADDLFLDSLYSLSERAFVPRVTVRVAAPMRTTDLVRRLSRVRAGNAAMRATGVHVRRARRLSWLTDAVGRSPRLMPAAACYLALTVAAALMARLRRLPRWERDNSTRASPVIPPAAE